MANGSAIPPGVRRADKRERAAVCSCVRVCVCVGATEVLLVLYNTVWLVRAMTTSTCRRESMQGHLTNRRCLAAGQASTALRRLEDGRRMSASIGPMEHARKVFTAPCATDFRRRWMKTGFSMRLIQTFLDERGML